jgi:hypothetical protein
MGALASTSTPKSAAPRAAPGVGSRNPNRTAQPQEHVLGHRQLGDDVDLLRDQRHPARAGDGAPRNGRPRM